MRPFCDIIILLMKYNELTYHKASPFYKQGYLPDRAWYNRKPKEFPSQIPTGQDYFTDSGRKHYQGKFNHSEIEHTGVLTSPEKYPFQNRLALDKGYMRSLDTTDIEGAGSGTRVNQAIRYKLRAQEDLARRYNQSLDMREHKEHHYEEKRRELAVRQAQNLQQKKNQKELENSRLSQQNSERQNPEKESRVQQGPQVVRNLNPDSLKGQQYIQLLPKPYYQHLEQNPQDPPLPSRYLQHNYNRTIDHRQQETQPRHQEQLEYQQQQQYQAHQQYQSQPYQQQQQQYQQQLQQYQQSPMGQQGAGRQPQNVGYVLGPNDRHKSNPTYVNNYESEFQRRREEYLKTIEMDHYAKVNLSDRREFRKNNPTNLSFSLAGQAVINSRY